MPSTSDGNMSAGELNALKSGNRWLGRASGERGLADSGARPFDQRWPFAKMETSASRKNVILPPNDGTQACSRSAARREVAPLLGSHRRRFY